MPPNTQSRRVYRVSRRTQTLYRNVSQFNTRLRQINNTAPMYNIMRLMLHIMSNMMLVSNQWDNLSAVSHMDIPDEVRNHIIHLMNNARILDYCLRSDFNLLQNAVRQHMNI
jgi:hypothetical protein